MTEDLGRYPKESSPCSCTNIRRAARAMTQFYDSTLSQSGLTITQLGMLLQIQVMERPGISQLAATFRVDRTTMNRNLKPLLEAGYVEIQPGKDARKREVVLTADGARHLEQGGALWQQAQSQLEDYLGKDELQQLNSLLSKIEAIVP